MECFTVDFLQFPSKDVTICLLGDWLGIAPSNPRISDTFWKFSNCLRT